MFGESFQFKWSEIRNWLSENIPSDQFQLVEENYSPESFGSGYVIYRVGQSYVGLGLDVHNGTISIQKYTEPLFLSKGVMVDDIVLDKFALKDQVFERIKQSFETLTANPGSDKTAGAH